MKKKILIGLGTLLICSAAFQILAADGEPSGTAPQPGIDVEIWARPTEVSPGEIVYAGGRVTNMGDLPDRVRVYLSVHTRVFSKRLARYEFKLRPGETERFGRRFRVPRLRPGTVLVFRAEARSARGASDRDAARVLVVN